MSTLPPDGPDYGQTPPSGGNYGNYGDYGQTPPPPPNFDKPVPAPSEWSVGDALAYGWKKFLENVGQIMLAALILLAGAIVAAVLGVIAREVVLTNGGCEVHDGALRCTTGSGWLSTQFAGAIQQFLASIVMMIVSVVLLRGALDITEGRSFQISGIFPRINLVPVIVAGLIVSVITAIGYTLLWLPGLVASFVFLFTPFFVLDKNTDGVTAITEAITFTRNNLSNMLVWFIVGGIVFVVGICLCGVGLLVTGPVVLIGAAYTYKKLTGQPVAP